MYLLLWLNVCSACQGSCLHEPLSRFIPVREDTYRGNLILFFEDTNEGGGICAANVDIGLGMIKIIPKYRNRQMRLKIEYLVYA